jgi:hypothetical protein
MGARPARSTDRRRGGEGRIDDAVAAAAILGDARRHPAVKRVHDGQRLDPRATFPRLALARVFWQLNRRSEAIGHARAGLTLARSDQQRAQAQEIIAFFERSAN